MPSTSRARPERPNRRILDEQREMLADLGHELVPESLLLVFVPDGGLVEIGESLCEQADLHRRALSRCAI